ncbi:hypothetical protein ACF1GY_05490 [Streptomyces sp. NPDC014684]|uniref:hypothetical protein n=1 Tax=Streptomyces sp. NPDC014684 TaxID=3364880 RepID=UPI0036F91184
MWDFDSFIAKAKLYFARAEAHPVAEDEVVALWLLLGLEFLLRAPLAQVHPTLLADPTGDSIMHAAGYPAGKPKSIQIQTVISRLALVIPEFKPVATDAIFLVGLRNGELHNSESPLAVDQVQWLPHFTRVVDVVCEYLDIDPAELVGENIIVHGRSLVDEEDKKLAHEIRTRIEAAKKHLAGLPAEEVTARREALEQRPFPFGEKRTEELLRLLARGRRIEAERVACPACEAGVFLRLEAVRTTEERLVDDEVHREVVYIARELFCPVCELGLTTTAEIRAAGIEQQYVKVQVEDLSERYLGNYDDYGND